MSSTASEIRQRASAPSSAKGASVEEEKEKLLRQYNNDDGHFSLVRNFRLADLITVSNAVCGTLSIFFCIHYTSLTANLSTAPSNEAIRTLYLAHLFPILGFGFDALDGRVARMTGGGSLLGQELDSLADLVSFGVAPATLAYTLGLRLPLDILSLLFFASCGLARLARFNATVALMPKGGSGSVKYFTGIPIPSSLGLTAFMAACVRMGRFAGAQGWVMSAVGGAGKAVLHGAHAVDWAAVRRQGDLPGGTVLLFGELGGFGEVHLLSLVFVAWGAAMVSKTLRVPKL
ncbi:CDP-diacylglycerol-serine O-phosphatidyltransferase [Naganishia albida]|nr:CDP-diacylglycerol-serine O-phosphatidyltransferase [Naganishia albida]